MRSPDDRSTESNTLPNWITRLTQQLSLSLSLSLATLMTSDPDPSGDPSDIVGTGLAHGTTRLERRRPWGTGPTKHLINERNTVFLLDDLSGISLVLSSWVFLWGFHLYDTYYADRDSCHARARARTRRRRIGWDESQYTHNHHPTIPIHFRTVICAFLPISRSCRSA